MPENPILNKKLLIILANSDTGNPEEFSVPLFHAMVTAAMLHNIDVVFTGLPGVLTVAGHAENLMLNVHHRRTVYGVIRQVQQASVVFKLFYTDSGIVGKGSGC